MRKKSPSVASGRRGARIEWPTLALIALCYSAWGLATFASAHLADPVTGTVLLLALVLHSSLQHEAIHGHPFPGRRFGAWLMWPPLGLFVPYARFRDQHLAHHSDISLTDPYDDPESNYLDPAKWRRLGRIRRRVLAANNTLAGRMILGPAVGMAHFWSHDLRSIAAGNAPLGRIWLRHLGALLVLGVVVARWGAVPLWLYAAAAYGAMSVLKIRTFLEHRAHLHVRGRSVIVEDSGPLSLLFLNNNLHMVHHMHPRVPWYRLPELYARDPGRYLERNEGYRYGSYAQVLALYLFRAKDPVAHPLMEPAAAPGLAQADEARSRRRVIEEGHAGRGMEHPGL